MAVATKREQQEIEQALGQIEEGAGTPTPYADVVMPATNGSLPPDEVLPLEELEDIGETLADGAVLHAEDALGQTLVLYSVKAVEGNHGTYVRCKVETAAGEPMSFTCGGQVVVRKLLEWEALVAAGRKRYPARFTVILARGRSGPDYFDLQSSSRGSAASG